MPEASDDEFGRFLEELTALSRRHGIEIGGCGCCGSPWLNHREVGSDEAYTIERDIGTFPGEWLGLEKKEN